MNAQLKPFLTSEHYLALERQSETRHEYFDGEVFAMSGGSRAHSRLIVNLIKDLGNALVDRPYEVLGSDMRVKVQATELYTYPDVSVVCGEALLEDNRQDTLLNPLVIVEVLSPSTELYDRGVKFDHYRQIPSLMEYVLVCQTEVRVEPYLRLPNGEWSLKVATGLEGVLSLPSLQVSLKLSDVYHKVTLPPAPTTAAVQSPRTAQTASEP